MLRRIFISLHLLLICRLVNGQEFIHGVNLYNRAKYDSVISVAQKFIAAHPEEEGLARYFVGESYYNKALAETDRLRSKAFFDSAWNEFLKAKNSRDLNIEFEEYLHAAYYKLAWCSYRLAEFDASPIEMLRRAHQEFRSVQAEAPDSLKLFSDFMAAECSIRENLLTLYQMADGGATSLQVNSVLWSLDDAEEWLSHVVDFKPSFSSPRNLSALQNVAGIRREALNYYRGKCYQIAPAELFSEINDLRKKADTRETARFYFSALNYDSLRTPDSGATRQTLNYLKMMMLYTMHVVSPSVDSRSRFQSALNKFSSSEFATEGQFRLAGVYQCTPDDEETHFNELALTAYDSASVIAESDYWIANIFMIEADVEKSRRYFLEFLDAMAERREISHRLAILIEDARIKKYLLDFETYYLTGKNSELKNLAAVIESFSPSSRVLQQTAERLNLLMHLALTSSSAEIWSNVLSGSDEEKLQQAQNAIRFIVSRVALNIGATREKYIALLNPLFEITQSRLIDATLFFRGIVKALEAEIQARPDEKIAIYKTAVSILSGVNAGYEFKDEADYVRGICLFYAEEFDPAREIFVSLVNEKHSLRALFYIAEIFRVNGRDRAARECYQAIVTKLKGSNDSFSEYWFANAFAGIASVDEGGDLADLAGIDLANIEFLPPLKEGALIFEGLADESFLKQQSTREISALLSKFGLPQKEIYPSKHVLRHSLLASENIFRNLPYFIDEVCGPLTATLKLTVIAPANLSGSGEALLNGETLESSSGDFYRSAIALNSELDLVVRHPGCYDYHQLHKFTKPGEDRKVVVLTKKINLVKTQSLEREHFAARWDGNIVLNHLPSQPERSALRDDFQQYYELRDVVFDALGQRFLAIDAEGNNLWVYSKDGAVNRAGALSMTAADSLRSPEGIAMDSHGNIFVADWGNHRIVEIDKEGRWVGEIGEFGSNTSDNIGQPIRLVFPTRVVILEDREGTRNGSETFYRESYLIVADQNGIHIANLRGEFLDTLLLPNVDFSPGSFYGFAVERKQDLLKMWVVDRSQTLPAQVVEYISK